MLEESMMQVSFFPSVVLPERLGARRDRNDQIMRWSVLCRYFVVIPQIHSNGISWVGLYGVCGYFLVPGQYRPVRQFFVCWCLLPEYHVLFVGLEKNFISRIVIFFMGRDVFLCVFCRFVTFDISLSMFVLINLYLVSSLRISWIFVGSCFI